MKTMLTSALAISAVLGLTAPATAQQNPFLGQITAFGFSWCPRDWTAADGALLDIGSNSALFSLYGTDRKSVV